MRRRRNSGASIMDLPEHIVLEIVLHLPIRGIVMCKCTCKIWFQLISSCQFAKLHFAHAKDCILLRNMCFGQISRIFYLIEPSEINTKYCCCDGIKSGYQVNMKLDTRLKTPLFNDESGDHNAEARALSEGNIKRKRTIKLDPYVHRFEIVNSCNGFLCLFAKHQSSHPIVVCNPVTNEYIKLPGASISGRYPMDYSGFGFCQATNQYKVLRVLYQRKAEIYTLGTKSWRSIGFAPRIQNRSICPTYLNGVLHWFSEACKNLVLSFDFSGECFGTLPELPVGHHSRISVCMGIFGDSICLSDASSDVIDIWVLKNCGVQKSWSKLISVNILSLGSDVHRLNFNFQLINCSNCKDYFIVYHLENKLIYYDPKREEWKNLRLHGLKLRPELVMHTPSFISLKDVASGANTESISTGFKVPGETRSLYLREEA